jgi:hypothetical protein
MQAEYYPSNQHSYRGNYEELALEPVSIKNTIADLLLRMERSLNNTFPGYKGDLFCMGGNTYVWVSKYGESSQLAVVDVRLSQDGKTVEVVVKKREF